MRLRVTGQICSSREVLAQQAVGVLIAAALPWAAGIAKVDLHVGGDGEGLVVGHLLAPIPCQRSSQGNPVAETRHSNPPKRIYKTTTQQLFADYGANEVATDEKIKDKIVEVGGTVDSIDKSFTDSIIISLRTSN